MKKNTNRLPGFSLFTSKMNALSIDVVIGALLSGLFVKSIIPFEVAGVYWIVLPLSVWIIYTTDHLVDAARLKSSANTDRHLFHYTYIRTFLILVSLFSMLVLTLVFLYLPIEVFYFGLSTGAFSILYFSFLHVSKQQAILPKEIIVAFVYTTGIWGVPLVLTDFNFDQNKMLLLSGFFILVLADILLLSYFELESDTKDRHFTMAVKFGKKIIKQIIWAMLVLVNIICFFLLLTKSSELEKIAAIIYLLMATLIMGMISFPEKLEKNFLYRCLVEFVFWLPGLILFYHLNQH